MSIGGPAVVRHIDRLEADGLVTRTRDQVDRRITRIMITAKGRRHLQKLYPIVDDVEAELTSVLTAREVQTLHTALDKLLRHVTDDVAADDDETDVA